MCNWLGQEMTPRTLEPIFQNLMVFSLFGDSVSIVSILALGRLIGPPTAPCHIRDTGLVACLVC